MDEGLMIDSMLRKPLAPIARELTWVDGSGLSRYNQATPRALVWVLTRILEEQGMAYIRCIFPAGGVSGTLADWYPGEEGRPYLFAKTGGLANCHSLSGYIVTKRGRVVVFSWMNNQFTGPAAPVRKAMEKMLVAIYEAY
jgi:D-alanyl-D-alanine carboxypeptidase/D-alanyl-D-alanine-endopeptidase (penicillin-binding protein 4)